MNCLLYARVSTDKQAQRDLSIPAQIEAMRGYAKQNGWKIVGQFLDEGASARTTNRPELNRLIQYCKENKQVDVVLIHKIDRLARNLVDYATIKAILKQKGIKLVSVSEPFEDNPVGNLLENIMASISEWYSANLGEEVKKTHITKLKRGEWPHWVPFGYKSVRDDENMVKHIPDSITGPLVLQSFELYSTENYSLGLLAEEMAERGLKTRYGNVYTKESMRKLLTRDFYMGKLVWNSKKYAGKHKPIVPLKLFYRVQRVLEQKSKDSGTKGKHKFLLKGIVCCRACGAKLTGEIHPRGTYYRCLPRFGKETCTQRYIPVGFLDSQLETMYEVLQPPKGLLNLLNLEMRMIADKRESIAKKEIGALKHTINEIEKKEVDLADELVSKKISQRVYEKLQTSYMKKLNQAESRLSQLEVDYNDPLDFLDKSIVIASLLHQLHQRFNFNQKKNLMKAVFKKIEVEDKAIVNVEMNTPFSILLGDDLNNMFNDSLSVGIRKDDLEQIAKKMAKKLFKESSSVRIRKDDLEQIAKKMAKKLFKESSSVRIRKDVFEQIIRFTLSEDYDRINKMVQDCYCDIENDQTAKSVRN
ncbi:MAG: recombinase family protein [Bacteroidetes bacterium]|nr:recombinase family protein [Bacteroidota bacterium]